MSGFNQIIIFDDIVEAMQTAPKQKYTLIGGNRSIPIDDSTQVMPRYHDLIFHMVDSSNVSLISDLPFFSMPLLENRLGNLGDGTKDVLDCHFNSKKDSGRYFIKTSRKDPVLYHYTEKGLSVDEKYLIASRQKAYEMDKVFGARIRDAIEVINARL
jgi:hypothetical protein